MLMRNSIVIGPDGAFSATTTSQADLDQLKTELLSTPVNRLVIYFHGGLVDHASGMRAAPKLAQTFNQAGAAAVTVVWETGVVETFRSNLETLHKTKLFEKLLAWTVERSARLLGLETGAKGGGTNVIDHMDVEQLLGSEESVKQLDDLLEKSTISGADGSRGGLRISEPDLDNMEGALSIELAIGTSTDPELVQLYMADGPGARGISGLTIGLFLAKVIIAVTRRHLRRTDHGLLATSVEELLRAAYLAELGKWAWDGIKRAASDMWIGDGNHVGGQLIRVLEAAQGKKPELKIDLIGHSAGTIAICHMLKNIGIQNRMLRINNVVFLAPACRFELLAEAIARAEARCARFRMFTMQDVYEQKDALVPSIYPRSLLYLVSGALEDLPDAPLAGLQRHVAKACPTAGVAYDDVRLWLTKDDRVVYAPSSGTQGVGLSCSAFSHTDFDENPDTLQSLIALAKI
jgi:hypothetical protein